MIRGSTIYSYRPCFTYLAGGKEYGGEATFTTRSKTKYNIGDDLHVFIDENNPEDYRFSGGAGTVIAGLIFLGAGLLFVVAFFL